MTREELQNTAKAAQSVPPGVIKYVEGQIKDAAGNGRCEIEYAGRPQEVVRGERVPTHWTAGQLRLEVGRHFQKTMRLAVRRLHKPWPAHLPMHDGWNEDVIVLSWADGAVNEDLDQISASATTENVDPSANVDPAPDEAAEPDADMMSDARVICSAFDAGMRVDMSFVAGRCEVTVGGQMFVFGRPPTGSFNMIMHSIAQFGGQPRAHAPAPPIGKLKPTPPR